MRVYVIGATGYIGSHVAALLAQHGHHIVGFARNDVAAEKLRSAGHQVYLGDVADLASLTTEASHADATIFAPQLMLEEEHATVAALLASYRDTGKTFIFTSGTGVIGQRTGGAWSEDSFTEDDAFTSPRSIALRVETENMVRASVSTGVKGFVARPPMIWGNGYFGAVELVVDSVRKTGTACYIGSGLNLYSHVHAEDLAELYRLILHKGLPGALYHSVGGELNNRCIAEFVAQRMGCKTRSVSMDEGIEIWGKFAVLIVLGASSRSRSPRARLELGWTPTRLDIVDFILNQPIVCRAE